MSLFTQLFWVQTPADGRLAVAARPRGGDWLDDEITGWHDAGISRVVSLLTAAETADLDLEAEASLSDQHAVEFTNLPVEDRSIPSSDWEALALARSIAADLTRGRNVVVHCRQGIGRAPLIAVCALLELGKELTQAINLVSDARGFPIPETKAQMEWLSRVAAVQLAAAKVH